MDVISAAAGGSTTEVTMAVAIGRDQNVRRHFDSQRTLISPILPLGRAFPEPAPRSLSINWPQPVAATIPQGPFPTLPPSSKLALDTAFLAE